MEEKEEIGFFRRHKTSLIVAGSVAAGIVVGVLVMKKSDLIINGVKATQIAMFGGTNIVITDLSRRGHPGIMVKHIPSGTAAASINHLSELLNVSRTAVYAMIKEGTVEVLGEAR